MSTAGSPMTAGPLKWSDIARNSFPASEAPFNDAVQRVQPWHGQVFATLRSDGRGQIEQKRLLGAGHQHLRAFAADTVDRVLLVWIEADEFSAFHPFLLHE